MKPFCLPISLLRAPGLALTMIATGFAASIPTRPNVLFIMADDFRPETTTYGSPALTPNLDRLAGRALQFERAYCQQALCNPSRSSMLTGRRPDTLRIWNNETHFREHNPDVTTLPQYFKEHGYVSRNVGKIFHHQGTKIKGDPRSWSAPEFLYFGSHNEDVPQILGPLPPDLASVGGRRFGKGAITECRDVPDEAYYDGRVAAEAVRVLEEIKGGLFFLAVGFWKPHAPFNAPKKYWDLYDREKLPPLNPARPIDAPAIAFHNSQGILGMPGPERVELTRELEAEMRHGYFASVSYLDAQLGKVLDALDRSGVADRTVIVFVSDHGFHLGEHGLWGKNTNFEYDARVPLLVATPNGNRGGQSTKALVELIDLFPTLTELAGLPRPADLEGASLVPVLRNPEATVRESAFTQNPRPANYQRGPDKAPKVMGYSVRTAALRYTEWRDWKSGEVVGREVYEDDDQPAETRNVVDAPEVAAPQSGAEKMLRARFPVAADRKLP